MKKIIQDNIKIVTALAVTVGLLLFTFIVAQTNQQKETVATSGTSTLSNKKTTTNNLM